MAIRCRCPSCRQSLSIADRKAGMTIRCPACKQSFTAPRQAEELPPTLVEVPILPTEEIDLESIPSEGIDAEPIDEPKVAKPEVNAPEEVAKPTEPPPKFSPPKRHPSTADDEAEDDDMQFRRPETEFGDMDMTPMVDVTFLLLIFFMITASFSLQKTIQVPPPDPDEQGATQSIQNLEDLLDESIKVEIDERNTIFIDDEQLGDSTSLSDTLRDIMRSEQKTELVLSADDRALHETVVAVIDAANEVGMQKIRLARSTSGSD